MNKLIPLLAFSFLLLAPVGIQTAFAGSPPITSCTLTPDMVNLELGANDRVEILKTVECDSEIEIFNIASATCVLNTVGVSPSTIDFDSATITEQIINQGDTSEEHCNAVYIVFDTAGSPPILLPQEIWVNEPEAVGGELIPIDSTSLILAGAQTFSWMIPVVMSVVGIGIFVVSRKN